MFHSELSHHFSIVRCLERHERDLPILVHQKQIEPVLRIIFLRHEHPDSVTPQFVVHSRVFHIPHSVHSQSGVSFL